MSLSRKCTPRPLSPPPLLLYLWMIGDRESGEGLDTILGRRFLRQNALSAIPPHKSRKCTTCPEDIRRPPYLNANRHQSNVVLFQYGFQHANLLTPVSAQLSPEPNGMINSVSCELRSKGIYLVPESCVRRKGTLKSVGQWWSNTSKMMSERQVTWCAYFLKKQITTGLSAHSEPIG